jgi:hypothetical protein
MEIPAGNSGCQRTCLKSCLTLAASLALAANGFSQPSAKGQKAINAQAAVVIQIQTIQDLQNISSNLAGNYQLANNIDGSATNTWNAGKGFLPIGSDATPFIGTLNGNGYTISGLFINSGATNIGFFGTVGLGGLIENINLTSVNISGAGGISGGTGGIFYDTGTGALVGHLAGGQVTNCTVTGILSGRKVHLGGLVGWSDSGSVKDSSVDVTINGSGSGSGNVLGPLADMSVGALVGANLGTIYNSTARGSVAVSLGPVNEGGLAGVNWAPGLIGNSQANVAVTLHDVGGVSTIDFVGGLVGFDDNATIYQSRSTGPVTGAGASLQLFVGGLVGYLNGDGANGVVFQSFATGSVSAAPGGPGGPNGNGNGTGGLVGRNSQGGLIQQCLASGAVTTTVSGGYLGGLVGINDGSAIIQSYSTGLVSGNSDAGIGGLVGENVQISASEASPQISQSYSTDLVQDPTGGCVGGLVGCNSAGGASSSYWDIETSSLSSSATGTGETTAQLQSGMVPAGFDSTVWGAQSGLYPYLLWMGPAPISGYVNPKYVVMGITYAPPGPSPNTWVQYLNSTFVGNTESLIQSFTDSHTFSTTTIRQLGIPQGLGIPQVVNGQITTTNSTTAGQTITDSSSVTTSMQVQQGEQTSGTGNFFAPVDHDYDVIWIWLNPATIFTVYGNTAVTWNGYGYDGTDKSKVDMDVVGIQLGYMNGDFGPMPPQFQSSIARAWAAGQVFPPGQGPGLTSDDLAQIASADPFSVSTYGPQYIGSNPPPDTPDHRFTLSLCSTSSSFRYNQAAPSSSAEIYTCTLTYTNSSTQTQSISTSHSQTFSFDLAFTNSPQATVAGRVFASLLPNKLTNSTTLTWTTTQQKSITTSTTSSGSLSVQGPPCVTAVPGVGPCVPVYDSAGNQPTQFAVYQDNEFGTFMFAPVNYYTSTPPEPIASVAPMTLSFGNQPIGTTSAAGAVTVTNNGTAPLSFTGIAAVGDFSVAANGTTCTTNTNAPLAGSCSISLTFTPTATGTRSGTLTITDNNNGVAGSTQTVSLSGTGTGSSATLSGTSLTFAPQLVNSTSASQSVTLTNSGNVALTISSISVAGVNKSDFSLTNTCGSGVAAGGNCTVSVMFTPTTSGSRNGSVQITDDAAGSPQAVTLSGTGEDFTISVAPGSASSATVAPGGTASYNLSVTPEDGLSGTVSLSCSGAPSEAMCTVLPSQLTLNGTSAAAAAVSVGTAAPSLVGPRNYTSPPSLGPRELSLRTWWLVALLAALLAICVTKALGQIQSRGIRRRVSLLTLLPPLLLALLLTSCSPSNPKNPGTPAGTYTLVVTATYTSGSSTRTQTINLTLTVN